MTNEELFEDLKQFIDAKISQATAGLATKDEMNARFDEVDTRFKEIDNRFNKVDERFDDLEIRFNEIQNAIGETLNEHDARITRLEQKLA